MADREYWCATQDPHTLAKNFRERIRRYRDASDRTGRRQLWLRAARMYYGLDPEGGFRRSHYVNLEGAEGQDLGMRANLFRPFIKSVLVMIAGSRPSFSCRPIAYDAATTETATIGDAFLDKALDEGVEPTGVECATKCSLYGEGWMLTTWDDAAGDAVAQKEYTAPDGQVGTRPICAGAPRVLSLRPDEVIRDPDVVGAPSQHRWLAACVQRNRWDLMAQYPMYAKEIHQASASAATDRWLFATGGYILNDLTPVNDDSVVTYELYHRKTLSMPQGLFALLVGDCIVSMGPLPYDDLPFDPMISDKEPGIAWGYGESWDLMGPQSMTDSVYMQLGTNRENFGRPNLWMMEGTDIEPYNVGGTRLITGPTPPQVIDLSTGGMASGEQFYQMTQQIMQRITGLNDATLGQAGSSTSGVALAQQQQTAVMFNSGAQLAYATMLQGSLTKLLRIAQKFMPDEQLINITGKLRAPMVKRFKGEDFAAIDGVSVELGSAALRTSGSRHALATELLQANQIQNADVVESFKEMIATGRVQPALEGPRARETMCERLVLSIQEGKPYAVDGGMPHALITDRLQTLKTDPSLDANVYQLATQTQQQHLDLWMTLSTTPQGLGLLAATGQQPHPAAQMMMQAPPPSAEAPAEGNPGDEQPADNQDVPNAENAPQPSPSGQSAGPEFEQPSLPEGAQPTA